MKFHKGVKERFWEFSGKVEIAITPIDKTGIRMAARHGIKRKSIRIEETTVEEVYQIILGALEIYCEKDESI